MALTIVHKEKNRDEEVREFWEHLEKKWSKKEKAKKPKKKKFL